MASGDGVRHCQIANGIAIGPALRPEATDPDARAAGRRAAGLPTDRPVVISIGAIDVTVKRMDHVVREVAALSPRPFLLLLGQRESETPRVEALAGELLDEGDWRIEAIPPTEVPGRIALCDLFVMASPRRGLRPRLRRGGRGGAAGRPSRHAAHSLGARGVRYLRRHGPPGAATEAMKALLRIPRVSSGVARRRSMSEVLMGRSRRRLPGCARRGARPPRESGLLSRWASSPDWTT